MTRFYTAAALLLIGSAVVVWGLPAVSPSAVVIGYAALFLPYVALLWGVRSSIPPPALLLVGLALLVRLVALPAEPLLSDDLYRYVWEGRVTLAGFNPFVLPPEAVELTALRDEAIWPLINHPEVPTIYPPVSQGFFALNALLGGGLVLLKALFVAFEAAMVALVWRVARDRVDARKLLFAFAIYALNPLVVLEVAWSGHLDVLAWGSLVAALVVWESDADLGWKTAFVTASLLAFSISAKLLGVLALPLILSARRRTEPTIRLAPERIGVRLATVTLTVLLVGASYLPFASAGSRLFTGFGTYAASWRSNEGGYRAMASLTQTLLDTLADAEDRETPGDPSTQAVFRFEQWDDLFVERGWTKEWEGEQIPATSFTAYMVAQTAAKAMAAFVCGLVLLWLMLSRWRPLAGMGVLLITLYFVAPTVHPWYVAWLVPLAALRPRAAPLAFSGLVLLGYGAWLSLTAGGPWVIPWWVVACEYGAVAALLLLPNNPGPNVEELDTFLA